MPDFHLSKVHIISCPLFLFTEFIYLFFPEGDCGNWRIGALTPHGFAGRFAVGRQHASTSLSAAGRCSQMMRTWTYSLGSRCQGAFATAGAWGRAIHPWLTKDPRQNKAPGHGKEKTANPSSGLFRLGDLNTAPQCKSWCLLRAISGHESGKIALRNGRKKRFWPGMWNEGGGLVTGIYCAMLCASPAPGMRGGACPTFFPQKVV